MHRIAWPTSKSAGRELPEVNVVVDRGKGRAPGNQRTDVANAVLFSMNGKRPDRPIIYTDPQGNEYYISAWLAEEHRKDLTAIEHVLLTTKTASRSC